MVGALPLSAVMAFGAFWQFSLGMVHSSVTAEAALFWYRVQFIGVAGLPVAMLLFVARFYGIDKWISLRSIVLLSVVPLVTQCFVWTDDSFHLFLQDITFTRMNDMMVITSFTLGIWFHIIAAYSYILAMVSTGWMFVRAVGQFSLYRKQSIAIISGTLAVAIPNFIFTYKLLPPDVILLPYGFLLMGLLISWSIFNNKFLDVVPIARNKLVDSMSDGMLLIDVRGRIVDLNVTMDELLIKFNPTLGNQPMGMMIGRPAVKVLQPWPDLMKQYEIEDNVQAEIALTINGEPTFWDFRISLVGGGRGQLGGRLMIIRDITSRVMAETAVISAKEEAEQANDALRSTNQELAASNAELEAFSSTVAHDLKAPLANIAAFSELLTGDWERLSPDEARSHLHIVAAEGNKAIQIVNDLLLLSHVRQTNEVETMPLDMGLIISEVLSRLQRIIVQYDAVIQVPETWPIALGHLSWVEAVWMNYLTNAIKYGGEPPQIELGATAQTDGYHRYWITDNGPGLTVEEQTKLFTPFTRLHHARAEGHGLGLAIVQRIVWKLSGQVGVESTMGAGSTFYFTLPAAKITTSEERRD